MIYYKSDTWSGQVFRWTGTVWPTIWKPQLAITLYTCAAYVLCWWLGGNLARVKGNYLGGILSFLLVFRANQSYSRYWEGRGLVTTFFGDLREVIVVTLLLMPGGTRSYQWRWKMGDRNEDHAAAEKAVERFTDSFDLIVSEERVDIIRWALVVAISFQLHVRLVAELEKGELSPEVRWHVDWDRFRIRCLVTAQEFRELDRAVSGLAVPLDTWEDTLHSDPRGFLRLYEQSLGPEFGGTPVEIATEPSTRLPTATVYQLTQVLIRSVNDQRIMDKAWGLAERFFPVLSGRMLGLNMILNKVSQIISTPLPFPYYHLCKTLLFAYFLSFPFFIHIEAGLWANIGELSCLAVALLGLDAIATELENPFGCDANDLCIDDDIYRLEREMLFYAKMTGDAHFEEAFLWETLPECVANLSNLGPSGYAVLRTQWESNGASKDVFPFQRAEREVCLDAEFMRDDHDVGSDDS